MECKFLISILPILTNLKLSRKCKKSLGIAISTHFFKITRLFIAFSGKRRFSVKLWKAFSDCFNCLPIAALVDERIFCCHGGLSPYLLKMDQIRGIERPTEIPQDPTDDTESTIFQIRVGWRRPSILFLVLVSLVFWIFFVPMPIFNVPVPIFGILRYRCQFSPCLCRFFKSSGAGANFYYAGVDFWNFPVPVPIIFCAGADFLNPAVH